MTSPAFSVAKFFNLLEAKIKAVNTFPLTTKNLVIQQDAYRRLGGEDDDSQGEIFATLECGNKQQDSDARFAVEFFDAGFYLHVEYMEVLVIAYEDFKSEAAAASQVIALLKMLAGGQLAILASSYKGETCAVEVLLYDETGQPLTIATEGRYRKWRNYDDPQAYDFSVARNHYLSDPFKIPKDFFLISYDKAGKPQKMGRSLKQGLSPLTKKEFLFIIEELNLQRAGKQPGRSMWSLLYRAWELWLGLALLGALGYGLNAAHLLPQVISQHPVLLQGVGLLYVYYVCLPLLKYKEQLKLSDPSHPYVRLDARLHRRPPAAKIIKAPRSKPTPWGVIQGVVGLAGAASLYVSGIVFHHTLHRDWLDRGSPQTFQVALTIASLLLVWLVILMFSGRLRLKLYNYLSDIVVFAAIVFIILSVNDKTDNMQAAPWLLFFAGFFAVIGINGISEFAVNRRAARTFGRNLE